jgi:hypothetical protein
MKSPSDKAMGYTAVVILAAIVLFMIIGVIGAHFMGVPQTGVSVP